MSISYDLQLIEQNGTLLILEERAIPLYAGRNLTVSVKQVDEGKNIKRTVNGKAINLSNPAFRKYEVEIRGSHIWPPSLDGLWVGEELTLALPIDFYNTSTGATSGLTAATGSTGSYMGYSMYRPVMDVMVTDFSDEFDEWAGDHSWSLTLTQV